MKTKVIFKESSSDGYQWRIGDCGYIDGYLMKGNDNPYAIVIKDDGKIVLSSISVLEVLSSDNI